MLRMSITWLLLLGHVTVADYDWFSMTTKEVCPNQSFYFPERILMYNLLYFESTIRGSTKQLVANNTHILLPSYHYQNQRVFIPIVRKQHEGEYYWTSETIKMKLKMVKLVVKDCSVHKNGVYGSTITLTVPKEASVLEFTTAKSADRWVLWSRINNDNKRGARGVVIDDHWDMVKITYADAGRYTFLRENGAEISSFRLSVKEIQRHHEISDFFFEERLPGSEAVLTFIDSSQAKHVLFENAMVTEEAFQIFGSRMNLQVAEFDDVTFSIQDLQSSDRGKYEVHDKNNRLVSIIYVRGRSNISDYSNLMVPIGVAIVIATLVICCCCVRKYCCVNDDAPVASPDSEEQPVYVHDPVVMSTSGNALQPQPVVTSRLNHYPPYKENTEHQPWLQAHPPTYHEVVKSYPLYSPAALVEASGGGGGGDVHPVPSAPLDPGPQYQPQGLGGGLGDFLTNSPLNMDTDTNTSAYESDKLNF